VDIAAETAGSKNRQRYRTEPRAPRDACAPGQSGACGRLLVRTPGQIIRKLREAERLLGEGKTILEAAELEISEQTFHRWQARYGGMKADDAKRLQELERTPPRPP
jgi:hypothetical protein